MFKYFLFWFPMLLIAVANGALRDLCYKKYTGELTAHQISTLSLIILFALYISLIIHRFPPSSATNAAVIGITWMIMTLIFEFGFGIWRGNSWQTVLKDYNILQGRMWILIPLCLAVAPYVFYKLMK